MNTVYVLYEGLIFDLLSGTPKEIMLMPARIYAKLVTVVHTALGSGQIACTLFADVNNP